MAADEGCFSSEYLAVRVGVAAMQWVKQGCGLACAGGMYCSKGVEDLDQEQAFFASCFGEVVGGMESTLLAGRPVTLVPSDGG